MEDIPDIYNVETLEQLRAIADELRMRVVGLLTDEPRTVTEVARIMQAAPGKIHYHVRELERLRLVTLVETREKGGILEKYYRAVAKSIMVPSDLLQADTTDEGFAAFNQTFQSLAQAFLRAIRYMMRHPDEPDKVLELSLDQYWMTSEEYMQVSNAIHALLQPYLSPRDSDDAHERIVAMIAYTAQQANQPEDMHAAKIDAPVSKPRRVFAGGAFQYSRKDLEKVVAAGETLDITVVGYCGFAKDIPAPLIDQAIAHFRCLGKLDASPEVREALKRKGG